MGRRASTKTNPVWVILLIVAFSITAAVGFFLFRMANDLYRTKKPLDISAYLDNSNSLRGNEYKVEGTVTSLLAWNPDEGRLISVEVKDPAPEYLPIFVPAQFNDENLQAPGFNAVTSAIRMTGPGWWKRSLSSARPTAYT